MPKSRFPAWTLSPVLGVLALCLSASAQAEDSPRPQHLHLYSIFYGPSVQNWSSHQPDPDLPITIRNFLTWNTELESNVTFGLTGSWNWRPVLGQDLTLRDPFAKIGRSNIVHQGPFSWYGDLRVHFAVTEASRNRDLWFGLQTFHNLSWDQGSGGAGLFLSTRYNQYGGLGSGDIWELYLGPNVRYAPLQNLSFQFLLEFGAGHPVDAEEGVFFSHGLDLEPSINWRLTKTLEISPYLSIPLDETARQFGNDPAIGMTASWLLF